MTDMLTLLCLVFATYRVSRMTSLEDGPWEVFTRLRGLVYRKAGDTWIERGVNCPLCLSVWIGILLTGLSAIPLARYGIIALAVSGMASLVFIVFEGRH